MTTAPKAQGFTAGENLHRLPQSSENVAHMFVQYLPQHSAIIPSSVSGAGQNKAAALGMKKKERRIVLHAAASDSRILQAGSRHSRLGTAVSRITGAESLGHIAHCGITHMKAARAEAAAGNSQPTHAGSRLNTNDAIRREPVPLGVRRSGM